MNIEAIQNINIEDYNYNLPDEKIAKYPLTNRDNSKLLIYKDGKISETVFKNISQEIPENSLLIYNNTKVIQARLHFKKSTGANIEIFCLEPSMPSEYNLIFQETQKCQWKCIVGNQKRWKSGELSKNIKIADQEITLTANKINTENELIIEFSWNNNINFGTILELIGEIPIPPYLNRKSEEIDKSTYQTIYSEHKGSVAAPTAGLHFTKTVFNSLEKKKIKTDNITLHVGAGTFKPVQTSKIGEHTMHFEHFIVRRSLIEALLKNYGKIFAVGTTTVRTLESLYFIGLKIMQQNTNEDFTIYQWEAYKNGKSISPILALENILNYMQKHNLQHINAKTQIMIAPSYKFKFINGLITNFHQPKSTLLLLISAITGEKWKDIYNYSLKNNFRFLSYGDSSILFIDK
jgi:S-adenosylmethionine:tRNA ribosyltransferase-isomerase